MQSLRSKFFIFLMKNRNILRFKFKKEVIDENFSVKEFRERIDKISEKMNKIPDDIKIKKESSFNINRKGDPRIQTVKLNSTI